MDADYHYQSPENGIQFQVPGTEGLIIIDGSWKFLEPDRRNMIT